MSIVRNFNLYLNAGNGSAPYINVNQYDQGEQWVFTLYKEDGTKYTPSTGAIVGIKADNRGIINAGTVDADGRVVINETQQMTAAAGIAIFELLIGGDSHGTANFLVNVEQRPGDNADLSDSDLSLIQQAVDSAAEIEDLLDGQDVPTVITPIITDWLDDNITNPSNPPIDTSLTVAGAAADAKVTGDEIDNLKSTIDSIENSDELRLTPTYVTGKGIGTNGRIGTSAKRMATEEFIDISKASHLTFSVASGYRLSIAFYSEASESAFVSVRYWFTGDGRLKKEGDYIRLTCSTVTEASAITLAEASNFVLSINYPLGDDVDSIQTSFDSIVDILHGNSINVPLTWVQGNPSSWSLKRIFAGLIDVSNAKSVKVTCTTGMQFYISYYDANKEYAVGRGWYSDTKEFTPEYPYFYVTLQNTPESDISPSDFTADMLSISYVMDTLFDNPKWLSVPTYWRTSLDESITQINVHEEFSDAQGDSFVFITDTHWESNAKNSPKLIDYLTEKTNVKKLFFGGDVLNLYSTQEAALEYGRDFYHSFKSRGLKLYSTLGNHDRNNNTSQYGDSAVLTYTQVYSYMFKSIEDDAVGMPKYGDTNGDINNNFYYYVDNEVQKIRYIVLNNGKARIRTNQTTWLKNKLTEMPSGWTAIIFAHIYWDGLNDATPVESVYGTDIETAINEVYDSMSGTVCALITGHTHYDFSKTAEKGYLIICTTTDAYQRSVTAISPTMTLGTDTEQAFDVFSIDTTNRKLYAVRVGAGSDREWSY